MEEQVNIDWSERALNMLDEIEAYISQYSEISAAKYIDGLLDKVERLEKYPESCAPCRNPTLYERGYRCCLYRNHIIAYKFIENKIRIFGIIPSRMNPDRMIDFVE